ncbi:ribosomal-protein-alanine N-acetyltransferase [Paenibacillus phyllosphaerae]|uniref:Ribosomal-protein-alanine N-acetyltransferase n=1 Tax=Paenibacillus phyllosphaerae TaxID=274593 RepID=A0A7W5FN45_9BACL|nr:ribosomal-protein-alanine N-acetyltransferase [Paenibacillus phyllosphaerae]
MNDADFFTSLPVLATERLYLRPMTEDDADELYHYYRDERVTRYLDWNGPSSVEEAAELIAQWNAKFDEKQLIPWGICLQDDHTLIGTVMCMPMRGTFEDQPLHPVNIGFELSADHHHQGIMTEALHAAIACVKETFHIHRLQAEVVPDNGGSLTLLKKLGFKQEGLLKQYLWHGASAVFMDVIMLALI